MLNRKKQCSVCQIRSSADLLAQVKLAQTTFDLSVMLEELDEVEQYSPRLIVQPSRKKTGLRGAAPTQIDFCRVSRLSSMAISTSLRVSRE